MPRYACVLLLSLLMISFVAEAQQIRGFSLTASARPGVGPNTLVITYTALNPVADTVAVWHIELDITRPANSLELSDNGLVAGNGFLADMSSFIFHDPATVRMVPAVASVPAGWQASLASAGKLFIFPIRTLLGPGQSMQFEVTTSGLPGIRQFCARPYIDEASLDVQPPNGDAADMRRYMAEVQAIEDKAALCGQTISPTAPPAIFKPLDFLAVIQSYKNTAALLGWIKNFGLANSLDAKLSAAQRALQTGDSSTAKNVLEALLNEIAAQANKGLSTEAVTLLQVNTQYLINKI